MNTLRVSPVTQLEKNPLQCRRPGFNPWVGKIPWRRERLPTPVFWPGEFHGLYSPWASLIAPLVKNLPAMQEMWVRFLRQEDPLEKEMATHSSIPAGESHGQRSLAGYIPWGLKSRTQLSDFHFQFLGFPSGSDRRRQRQPTYFSTLAWKIPWMEEPGRLQSMGLLRVGHD